MENLVIKVPDQQEVQCTLASGFSTDPPFTVKEPFVLHQNTQATLKFTKAPRFYLCPVDMSFSDEYYMETRIWRCRKDPKSRFPHTVSTVGLGDTITVDRKK
jgi:hypothetical protein